MRGYLLNRKPHWPQSGDSHPLMMVVVTRVMMPIALMVGAYIFFRGHNQPGGGFIAGLIVAIAYLMQYMASGYTWAIERQRFYYHGTIGWGVLIAAATGLGAWFNERPFLTSDFGYIHWPPLEEFEWATAIAVRHGRVPGGSGCGDAGARQPVALCLATGHGTGIPDGYQPAAG